MDKLTVRELLRYGYSGLLCVLVAVAVDGEATGRVVSQLGDVLSPLTALAAGTAVYLLFRTIIGELFLWRFLAWSHGRVELALGRSPDECKVHYCEQRLNVRNGRGLDAFILIRDKHFAEHTRERFHVQHSEGYLLFITALVCGVIAILAAVGRLPNPVQPALRNVLVIVAILAFFSGWWHDIVLCRAERATVAALDKKCLAATLTEAGFVVDAERSVDFTKPGPSKDAA